MGRPVQQVGVIGMVGGKMAADRGAVAEHRAVDDRLPVHGQRDRLAHPRVVQRRVAIVHRQDRFTLGRADDDLEPGIGLQLVQRLGRGIDRKGVHVAGHHGGKGGGRVRDEPEDGRFQRRFLAPVAVKGGQRDMVALGPFAELEGPGADRTGRGVGGGRRVHDRRVAPGHLPREIAVRPVQRDADQVGRHRLDRGDVGEQLLLRVRRFRAPRAVQREDHVRCVEFGAVVKPDPGPQLEFIDRPAVLRLPAFGKAGDDPAVRGKSGQPLEQIGIDDLVDGGGGVRRRVQPRRFQDHAQPDRVRRGQRRCGCQRQRGGRGKQSVQHRVPLKDPCGRA